MEYVKNSKTIWGKERRLVVNKKSKKFEIIEYEDSAKEEKKLIKRSRFMRMLPYQGKWNLEQNYERTLWIDYNNYLLANMPWNLDTQQEKIAENGPILMSVEAVLGKMHGAVLYQAFDSGELEWVEDIRTLSVGNIYDVDVRGLDLRYGRFGYDGFDYFKSLKNLQYLNLSYTKNVDDWCMSRLHMCSQTLQYLDLSGSRISAKGFGYLRLLTNLKWLNISDLENEEDVEKYIPYLIEILPPNCTIITSSSSNPESPESIPQYRITAGGDSEISEYELTAEVVHNDLFALPEPGYCQRTSPFFRRLRQNALLDTFNNAKHTNERKKFHYRKYVERFPPLW